MVLENTFIVGLCLLMRRSRVNHSPWPLGDTGVSGGEDLQKLAPESPRQGKLNLHACMHSTHTHTVSHSNSTLGTFLFIVNDVKRAHHHTDGGKGQTCTLLPHRVVDIKQLGPQQESLCLRVRNSPDTSAHFFTRVIAYSLINSYGPNS